MQNAFNLNDTLNELQKLVLSANPLRSLLILIVAIFVAYFLSKYLARGIITIAQIVSTHSDNVSSEETHIKLRQVETYLSVAVAGVRASVVAVVAYVAWRLLSPASVSGAAAIGASAFFIVFAGQTLGTLLKDVTVGATMIIEQWFNVGDFIKIEPFMDVSGVVERFTLRSTKMRALNGEVLWIHNQQIQAVHVVPRGIRTLAVDVFVRDKDLGEKTLKKLINAVPTGPTLLAQPLQITTSEHWNDDLWRITVIGQTAPGREWLIEKFFVNAIKEVDEAVPDSKQRVFVYEPIARYADSVADSRFKRAIRANKHN